MVVMVLAHMTQVFLHGAYKYPRELTWVAGRVPAALHAGHVLHAARSSAGTRTPTGAWPSAGRWPGACRSSGPWVVRLLLGGPVIGGDSLSRFFALHVFVIPGALLLFLAVHLWLVLKRGISAPPVPGQAVDPKTYDEDYEKQLKTRRPLPRRRHAEGRPLLGPGRDRRGGRWPPSSGRRGRPGRPTRRCPAPTPGPSGRSCGCSPCCRSARPRRRPSSSWCSR